MSLGAHARGRRRFFSTLLPGAFVLLHPVNTMSMLAVSAGLGLS